MFAMCNLLETGFLWCLLLNFELLRKAFDQNAAPNLETVYSGDLYEKKIDWALFVGLTVLGIVEIIVFVDGIATNNFSLAASIFIATLSCLVGLVVFI